MTSLDEISCARIPLAELASLAELRGKPGVEVAIDGATAWVRWGRGDDFLQPIFSISGVILYASHRGNWYRFGKRLPEFDFPTGLVFRPLDQVLFPERVEPVPPPALHLQPVELKLAPDQQPRQASLVECTLTDLQAWVDRVPTVRLESLHVAWHGERVLLLGSRLPLFSVNQRFWGESLFLPLGFRLEPYLPDKAIREALEIHEDEYAVFRHQGVEAIPCSSFGPLSRAGIRQACLPTTRQPEGRN